MIPKSFVFSRRRYSKKKRNFWKFFFFNFTALSAEPDQIFTALSAVEKIFPFLEINF